MIQLTNKKSREVMGKPQHCIHYNFNKKYRRFRFFALHGFTKVFLTGFIKIP